MSTDPTSTSAAPTADPIPAVPEPVGTVSAEATSVTSGSVGGGERIGRFTRAELEAMRGKRGRKPAEYHQLFPPSAEAAAGKPAAAPKAAAKRRAPRLAPVSSAVIGEHTIDELLEMIGSTGRKPVAYDILHQAAQVFADLGALTLPEPAAAEVDPLAAQLAGATAQVRETIAALLAATTRAPRKPRVAKVVAAVEPAAEPAAG